MRRLLLISAILVGSIGFVPSMPTASACPMCQVANEEGTGSAEQNARPRAYMYSILFMLAMPATLFSGFSFGFYRLWKKQQVLESLANADSRNQLSNVTP
ncbi:MAG: hypothetical protein DWQ34_17725 [Planctomycetota bacterium]|nr:MAG: hypothetical protein DWQ34_17725 [Planctomycetota bacterium]REJ91878.1 MAG: hypothetical protein DWQ29_05360 [Planctomycetota bacterium]REK22547.1 MAG: hypothetical protein DWQ41_18835 [Planctomycetota bacterium]REK36032.1 MAG: hypothetical protein DWQ45_10120 [Planctomycetota bacterium]